MNTQRFLPLAFIALLTIVTNVNGQSAPPSCLGVLDILGSLQESNDTVYTCVGMPLTFSDESILDGILTNRDWTFGDGEVELDAPLSQTTHSYTEEGTYTVTLTVASLLCAEVTIANTVIVLGNPNYNIITGGIDCFGDCDGELTVDVQSDNAPLYIVYWDIVGEPGITVSNLCAGDYTAIIADGLGCTDLQTSAINLPAPEEFLSNIDLPDTLGLCPSSGLTDIPITIVGGAGNYQAVWNISTAVSQVSPSLMQFTPTELSLDLMYSLQMFDAVGCIAEDSIFIESLPSFLGGTVSVGSGPCIDCDVFQYHFDTQPGVWHVLNSTITDGEGNYDFGIIENFLPFTIMADPNETNHPMASPGFYPEGHLWSTATVLADVCGLTLNKHVALSEPMNFGGSNSLNGTVFYSASGKTQTEEDPIPLIDVVVEKTPPGQAQGRVATNNNGEYEFQFVPNSDTLYTLHVSLPGVPVSSTYEILADQGSEIFSNLNFCLNIDSTEIEICQEETTIITEGPRSTEDKGFAMYPNPSNGRFVIETGIFADTNAEIRIVDGLGRMVFQKKYAETPYTINMVNLAEGYYFVQMLNSRNAESLPISVLRH